MDVKFWKYASGSWLFLPVICNFHCLTYKIRNLSLTFSIHKKITPTDICQCLLNIYKNQIVDVNTVRQCVMHFNCGKNDIVTNHVPGSSAHEQTPVVIIWGKNTVCSWKLALSTSVVVLLVLGIVSNEYIYIYRNKMHKNYKREKFAIHCIIRQYISTIKTIITCGTYNILHKIKNYQTHNYQ